MVVALVDVTTKDHSHDQEAILVRKQVAIDKQSCEHVEIWHADVKSSARHHYPHPILVRRQQFARVVEMLQNVRGVNLCKSVVSEASQISSVRHVIHSRPRVDVEYFPALGADVPTNVKLAGHSALLCR